MNVDDIGAPDVCTCGHGWDAHRKKGRCELRRCRCPFWIRDYEAVDRYYQQKVAAP